MMTKGLRKMKLSLKKNISNVYMILHRCSGGVFMTNVMKNGGTCRTCVRNRKIFQGNQIDLRKINLTFPCVHFG